MARFSGDGSYQKLFMDMYGKYIMGDGINNLNKGIVEKPLSFSHIGHFDFISGGLANRAISARYWMGKIYTNLTSRSLSFSNTYYHAVNSYSMKGYGFSVRCVAKLATDSICPKGWEMARYKDDKSFSKLLVRIYGKNITQILNNTTESDGGIKSLPTSFIKSGSYFGSRGVNGCFWSRQIRSLGSINDFIFSYYRLLIEEASSNNNGYSVRWGAKSML